MSLVELTDFILESPTVDDVDARSEEIKNIEFDRINISRLLSNYRSKMQTVAILNLVGALNKYCPIKIRALKKTLNSFNCFHINTIVKDIESYLNLETFNYCDDVYDSLTYLNKFNFTNDDFIEWIGPFTEVGSIEKIKNKNAVFSHFTNHNEAKFKIGHDNYHFTIVKFYCLDGITNIFPMNYYNKEEYGKREYAKVVCSDVSAIVAYNFLSHHKIYKLVIDISYLLDDDFMNLFMTIKDNFTVIKITGKMGNKRFEMLEDKFNPGCKLPLIAKGGKLVIN